MTVADLAGTARPAYPDEEKALNAALAKAQGEFPPIQKDKTAQAGSYSYTYADLATILNTIRPILSSNGLSLVQRLENPGGNEALRTELRHSDGAVIAASFPIGERPGTPQQLGSLLTYLRRYAIVAILGIAAEEDDDGGQASAPTSNSLGAEASPFQVPDIRTDVAEEDLTAKQRSKIFALKTKLTAAGVFDDDQFKEGLVASYYVDSVSGLTKDQASDLIGRLISKEEELDESDSG